MKIEQIINMATSSSVDELPDEIIELILSNCPIKSVGRFKSVSKSWQSIISDPRFRRLHRIQRSKLLQEQNTFFLWEEQRWYGYEYGLHMMRLELEDENFRSKSESLRLGYPASCGESLEPLCSCNGLILILFTEKKEYMLWNPFTRKHIIIPAFHPKTQRKAFRKCTAPKTHFYPHPNPRPHIYHDSVTDDYKIVFHYERLGCYAVFSCRNGSWGEVRDFPHLDWEECVYGVEGSCLYGVRDGNTEIISFDARDEKLHKFPLPEGVECLVEDTVKLEAVSGRLCLYGFSDYEERRLHLWVMEENRSFDRSWRKLISMEKTEPLLWYMRPVCLTNKDVVALQASVEIFNFLSMDDNEANLIYNPHGNCTFEQIDDRFTWQDPKFFFPYSENLDMPYSNTPPSASDKCRKRRNDPTSCERRKRPEKGG